MVILICVSRNLTPQRENPSERDTSALRQSQGQQNILAARTGKHEIRTNL